MKFAAVLSSLAPQLQGAVAKQLEQMGMPDAPELAERLVLGFVDGLHEREQSDDGARRTRFIVDAAVHVLNGAAGEPTVAAGIEAVDIVTAMLEHAEKPAKKRGPPAA
jgi:hypothetical protein